MKIILIVVALAFGNFAYAQGFPDTGRRDRSPTIDVQYEEEDRGSYWVENVEQDEIDELNDQSAVSNLRIPILLGIKVSDLSDTWGDARSGGRTHEGIDIIAPRGSFIVSPTDAVVTTVANSGNGGMHVFTRNPGGEKFYFAHLDSFAKGLREGQVLKAGDLIGYVGNTGNASGGVTHLHFGIYQDNRGGAVNPFPRLKLQFSLRDIMASVTKFLNASNNAPLLAQSLGSQYKETFIEAQASGIALPSLITQVLTEKKVEALGISRTLQVGSSGDDVKWLQAALGVTADGSFGPKTKAAVVAFQLRVGLPGDGVFGATSRLALSNSSIVATTLPSGCTSTSAYSVTTGARCTPVILTPLRPGCTATSAYSITTGIKCT